VGAKLSEIIKISTNVIVAEKKGGDCQQTRMFFTVNVVAKDKTAPEVEMRVLVSSIADWCKSLFEFVEAPESEPGWMHTPIESRHCESRHCDRRPSNE
jgi:hypothetical protein